MPPTKRSVATTHIRAAARDHAGRGVLRRELRMRGGGALRARPQRRTGQFPRFGAVAATAGSRPRPSRRGRCCVRGHGTAGLERVRNGHAVDRVFSPVCRSRPRRRSRLDRPAAPHQGLTLDILNRDGRSVRTIVRNRREPAGRVSYTWDGRGNLERVVPEGVYRPRPTRAEQPDDRCFRIDPRGRPHRSSGWCASSPTCSRRSTATAIA